MPGWRSLHPHPRTTPTLQFWHAHDASNVREKRGRKTVAPEGGRRIVVRTYSQILGDIVQDGVRDIVWAQPRVGGAWVHAR